MTPTRRPRRRPPIMIHRKGEPPMKTHTVPSAAGFDYLVCPRDDGAVILCRAGHTVRVDRADVSALFAEISSVLGVAA
jgi:hypothetical protein